MLLLSCSLLVHVVLVILDRDDMFVCPVTLEVVIIFLKYNTYSIIILLKNVAVIMEGTIFSWYVSTLDYSY